MKSLSPKAAEALRRSKDAALNRIRRIQSREKEMQSGAIGLGAGYFAARWFGKRRADVTRGDREIAGFKLGSVELDGTKLGAGVALVGAMGMLGDDQYDDVAYAAGLSVLSADQAINAYETRLQEPPSE